MKKNILASLLLICLWPTGPAQAQLLWEIAGNGLKHPSYLYGTMHLGDKRVTRLSDSTWKAFNRSEVFAGEMVMDASVMFKAMGMIMSPADSTLSKLLPPEKYKVVQAKLAEKLGPMSAMFERMKPLFISPLLSGQPGANPLDPGSEPSGQGKPLDLYLQDMAAQRQMEVVGLETFEEQMEAFNSIPLKLQAEMLYEQVANEKDSTSAEMSLERMIGLYERQALDSLYELTSGELNASLNERLLTRRNHNMADRMEKLMQSKRVFTGVGAAHLPGPAGVIALLRQKGYRVSPVKFK
jgi:hypothetical protein